MHCSERFMSDVAVVDRKSESRGGGGGDKRSAPPFSISPPFAITEIHNIAVECATYLLYSSFLLSSVFVCSFFFSSSFFSLPLSNHHGRKNDAVRFIFDDELRIDRKGFPYARLGRNDRWSDNFPSGSKSNDIVKLDILIDRKEERKYFDTIRLISTEL